MPLPNFSQFQNRFDPRRLQEQMQQQAPMGPATQMPSAGIMPASPGLPGLGEIPQGSLFQPPRTPPPTMSPAESEQEEMLRLFNSQYTPESRFSDQLNEMITNAPQRDPNLSKARKLGGFLVGFSQGPEAQDKAMYAPYHRELEDWKTKLAPTLQGAQLERYANANERQLAAQTASSVTAARRARTGEEALKVKEEDLKRKGDIAERKIKLDELTKNDKDWDLVDDLESGYIFAVHPRLGKINTQLKHGDMSELDKARWRQRGIETREAGDADDWQQVAHWRNGIQVGTSWVKKGTNEAVPITYPGNAPGPPGPAQPPKPPLPEPSTGPHGPNSPPNVPPPAGAKGLVEPPLKPQAPPSAAVQPNMPQSAPEQEPMISRPPASAAEKQHIANRLGELRATNPRLAKFVTIDNNGQLKFAKGWKPFGYQVGPTPEDEFQLKNYFYPGPRSAAPPGTTPPGADPNKKGRFVNTSRGPVYIED